MNAGSKAKARGRLQVTEKRSEQICLRLSSAEMAVFEMAYALDPKAKSRNAQIIRLMVEWALQVIAARGTDADQAKFPPYSFEVISSEFVAKLRDSEPGDSVERFGAQRATSALAAGPDISTSAPHHPNSAAPETPGLDPALMQAFQALVSAIRSSGK
jgi:hypothetical protein